MINLKSIFSRKNRILLNELVRTDFKLRYQDSALGYVWSVLSPLMLFAILYLVFDKFLGIGRNIEHYPIYLLTGIVLWRFFTEATNSGLRAIVQRGGLIRKINFPKYIIVISGTISSFINLGINFLVVFLFMIINGVEFSWNMLLIIPLVIELYIFALAISFFLSAVNVKLRDTGYLWDVFLQAAFYATPIIYPLNMIAEKSELVAQILLINPAAQIIQDIRHFLVTDTTITMTSMTSDPVFVLAPFAVIAVIGVIGYWYFKKSQASFAEEV